MINAIVVGAAGRMGRMIVNAIQNSDGITCAGAIEIPGHPSQGQDVGVLAGVGELGVTIEDNLKSAIQKGDVIIDFTAAEASLGNMEIAAQHHKPMVVGSTDFHLSNWSRPGSSPRSSPVAWPPI
jgi:4-hydroxy-tetrahydrodipicolinate reductase